MPYFVNKKITIHGCDTFMEYLKMGPLAAHRFKVKQCFIIFWICPMLKTNIFPHVYIESIQQVKRMKVLLTKRKCFPGIFLQHFCNSFAEFLLQKLKKKDAFYLQSEHCSCDKYIFSGNCKSWRSFSTKY